MYIILESYPEDDPRLVPEIEFLSQYSFWIYEVAYIIPENVSKVPLNQMLYEEVPENIARAVKFAKGDEGKIGIVEGSNVHQELLDLSTAEITNHPSKPKVYYHLVEKDYQEVTEVFKVAMRLYLKKHYTEVLTTEEADTYDHVRTDLLTQINQISNYDDALRLMHTRFRFEAAGRNRKVLGLGNPEVHLSVPGRDNF